MKAFYFASYGGPEVMQYGDIPDPVADPGKVIVEVRAVSLNPLDYKIRSGKFRLLTGGGFPKVPGADFAGTVKQGEGFRPGDRVYGALLTMFGKQGALAGRIAVDPKGLRPMPDGMSFEEAASLPVAGLTALAGWRKAGDIGGAEVLLTGATGGVGHMALQVASARGAAVTAVCSAPNAETARRLGARRVLDYARTHPLEEGRMYRVIFDAAASLPPGRAMLNLERGGIYLSTLFTPGVALATLPRQLLTGRRAQAANMRARPADYEEMEQLWRAGTLKPLIEHIYPLDRAADAFAVLEHGKVRGKVIVTLSSGGAA
ncbi:MAG: NAD(P)-dependent alcohol dehydrogenase [Bacteroidota bacterium]